MKKRYSKSSDFYRSIKSDFFDQNDLNLGAALRKNRIYTAGPIRSHCKLCEKLLPDRVDFSSHGVSYVFCETCDHLNGCHQDTMEFCKSIYSDNKGADYASFYLDDLYENRLKNIYMPKVAFLRDHLPSDCTSLYDFGCGLGHFVNASIGMGFKARGGDVSETLIDAGNDAISHRYGIRPLECFLIDQMAETVPKIDVDILSALAVIEHLSDLSAFIEAVQKASFKYFYFSVPTYGLSVAIESCFDDVFPRHLSGGHTHLFTETSLNVLYERLDVTPIAEWRFGTDIIDLRRAVEVKLKRNGASLTFLDRLNTELNSYSDDLQSVVDQHHNCSQIHVVCARLSDRVYE